MTRIIEQTFFLCMIGDIIKKLPRYFCQHLSIFFKISPNYKLIPTKIHDNQDEINGFRLQYQYFLKISEWAKFARLDNQSIPNHLFQKTSFAQPITAYNVKQFAAEIFNKNPRRKRTGYFYFFY